MKPAVTAFAPLGAALAWVVTLLVDPGPFPQSSTVLIGVGLLAISTTAVVGLVVTGARWAHRLAMVSVAGTLAIATLRPIDTVWWLGLVLSAAAAAVIFLPSVTAGVRKLPSADGPPPAAVIPPLALLASPLLVGLFSSGAPPLAALIVGLSAPLFAYFYTRVLPGGLWGVRLLWPLLALWVSPALGVPAGVVTALLAIVIAGFAWRPEVKASYHPPREVGSTFPIPPEMTPPEVLDAAHIDETGKPL